MYDRFIERLAVSKYRDNFILKGGFYLSTLFGLESRSTKDIDTAIKDANFTKENVEEMIKSIISIDINDGALINFVEIGNIREEDQYGGVFEERRVNLLEDAPVDLEDRFNKQFINLRKLLALFLEEC